MEGNYKINNVNITPINTSISKTEDGKFLYYQVFDMNELKIKDTKNVKIDVNIYKIKETTASASTDFVVSLFAHVSTEPLERQSDSPQPCLKIFISKMHEFFAYSWFSNPLPPPWQIPAALLRNRNAFRAPHLPDRASRHHAPFLRWPADRCRFRNRSDY